MEWIKHILRLFTVFDFFDFLDIILLTAVIFSVYQFIKERRAGKLALGVGLLFIFLIVCEILNLHAIQYILSNLFRSGIVVLAIIFQPELRSALEKMGDTSIKGIKNISDQRNGTLTGALIEEFTEAVFDLAKTKTGALIVFERNTKLGEIILTGTVVNAQFSGNLLKSIFFNKAPLHDGAVIIRANRIHSAACILPLESDRDLFKDLGTRHRAAIGISEISDCVAVVVSEETGIVSIAHEGNIYRNFTKTSMKSTLQEYLIKGSNDQKKRFASKAKNNSKND
ncbi:MAG: TIGR00159 family protein [Ruminococcaceae bacterium]|nr:TIGR00159 family protein [Oscillospiraceae bacterium]